MILVLHITAAILGLLAATANLVRPTAQRQRSAILLTGTTIASGTYLIATTHTNILHTCLTGLIYTAAIGSLAVAAQRRHAS